MTQIGAASSTSRSSRGAADASENVQTAKVLQMPKPVLACRSMTDQDIEPAILLLASGFPERSVGYWRRALLRLRDRAVPEGRPRYGYVMTDGGRLVGIILTIFSETDTGTIRGNVSSWYVETDYRGFSHLLLAFPLKLKGVTLLNISPAPNTIDTIGAQGFSKYVGGSFYTVAALSRPVAGARVQRVSSETARAPAVLHDHLPWGCLAFMVSHGGKTYPFMFVRARFLGDRFPCAQLVYCRDIDDFVRFAGPLGRALLRLGLPAVIVDSNGPISGLPGLHRADRSRRYYRGDDRPRLGDLSFTELAIFGA